jgi:alpha-beta hydrolase superfamily lysophospholipase
MHAIWVVLAAFLGINALHAIWIGVRRRRWEARIRRGPDGVAEGAEAYTVGDGPVAVLWLHGFADTPQTFRRMAERLAATGRYTCRAMRFTGAAEALPVAARQTVESALSDLRAEVAGLRRRHRQVWLAGHSMGASIGLLAVLEDRSLADGIVVLAPMIRVSRRRSPLLPPQVWFILARLTLPLTPTFESCFSVDAVAVDDPAFTYHRDRFIPFATYRTVFRVTAALAGRGRELRVPVFAALPEDDRVVDMPAARRWLAECPEPKRVMTLPDTAHAIPLEAGWRHVTDEIANFIQNRA